MKKLLLVLLALPLIGFGQIPFAILSGGGSICNDGSNVGVSVNFSGVAPFTFVYEIDGINQPTIITSVNPHIILTQQGGIYTLYSFMDSNGVGGYGGSVTVAVYALPAVNAGIDQTVCTGTAVTLSGSGAVSYFWDNGVTDGTSFIASLGGSTTYTVIGIDDNGCTNSDQVTITQLPATTSSYDTLVSAISINWNGLILNSSGDYSVTLINSVGCDSIVNLNLTITTTGISDITSNKSNLVKITDVLGKETPYRRNTTLFYIYNDGTVEKKVVIE
jgi:hypothetical protein